MKTTNNIWVEITKSEHKHGGDGWEFGTCLWSPSKNRAGNDRYGIMREPKQGETVLHFYNDVWPDGRPPQHPYLQPLTGGRAYRYARPVHQWIDHA